MQNKLDKADLYNDLRRISRYIEKRIYSDDDRVAFNEYVEIFRTSIKNAPSLEDTIDSVTFDYEVLSPQLKDPFIFGTQRATMFALAKDVAFDVCVSTIKKNGSNELNYV